MDREPTPVIAAQEDVVRQWDLGGKHGYSTVRGLDESSAYTAHTPFGKIEDNIATRIQRLCNAGNERPAHLLTVGAGVGETESELDEIFGDSLIIDTLTLSDIIFTINRGAFRRIYLGNIDTHLLPEDYDLIVSVWGAAHAMDQRRVFVQFVRSLKRGGEACYSYFRAGPNSYAYNSYPPVSGPQRARLYLKYGLTVGVNGAKSAHERHVYLRKDGDIADAEEAVASAERASFLDDVFVTRADEDAAQRMVTSQEVRTLLFDALLAHARSSNTLVPAALLRPDIRACFMEEHIRICLGAIDAGFTVREAIRKNWGELMCGLGLMMARAQTNRESGFIWAFYDFDELPIPGGKITQRKKKFGLAATDPDGLSVMLGGSPLAGLSTSSHSFSLRGGEEIFGPEGSLLFISPDTDYNFVLNLVR